MEKIKRLTFSFALVSVIAVSAFAGETETPPCADPGQTSSPPCPAQYLTDDPAVLGQTENPATEPLVSVTDIAETVLWSLLLF